MRHCALQSSSSSGMKEVTQAVGNASHNWHTKRRCPKAKKVTAQAGQTPEMLLQLHKFTPQHQSSLLYHTVFHRSWPPCSPCPMGCYTEKRDRRYKEWTTFPPTKSQNLQFHCRGILLFFFPLQLASQDLKENSSNYQFTLRLK